MDNLRSSLDIYNNEKEYSYETKSEEEINRYTLKEDLSTLQRTKEILSYGDLIQRIAIYKSLPILIQEFDIEERLMELVGVIYMIVENHICKYSFKQLESMEPQVQIDAGFSYLKMIEEKVQSILNLVVDFNQIQILLY